MGEINAKKNKNKNVNPLHVNRIEKRIKQTNENNKIDYSQFLK